MDKQIKSYAQLYSGNWNHGGLLRSWPDDIAGSTTASRSKGHRLFLRQALHSSLSVILDERMFYVGSDDEGGEDSSSEVFAGPEGSSPDKHEPPQPPGPRRPYQQLPQKHRSHSGSDPPVLKKLPSRTHSVHGDISSGVRSRSCGSSIGGSGSSMKGSVASAGTRSRVVNGLEGLHKNESFPKSSKRRNLSSSSLPGGLVSATSLSASASVDYGDRCDREGGGESGYGGSEVSGCTPSGVSGSGVLSSSSPSSTSLSPASLTRGFQVRMSPRGQQDGRGTHLARSASDSSGHVRCASSPSSFSLTSPPPPLPPPPEVATASRLQDLDIVGESFESRFPWQRDVAVQCNLSLYTYRRARLDAVSTTSSSGGELLVSSVDFASNNNNNNNNNSNSPHNQTSLATTGSISSSSSIHLHHQHTRHHHPGLSGHSNSLHGVSSTDSSLPGVTRRANFMKRPRPSSLGALENARYQSELSRFRDLVTRRGERKSDPQVMMTSPGWRRVPLGLQEDVDSVSDLESILEYPDECPSDLSRQTSFASFDAEDDIMRHYDGYVADMAESADYCRSPTDVLHSPSVSPPLWAAFDDGDMSDSDESEYVVMNGLPAGEHHSLRFRRTKPPRRLSSGSLTSGSENEAEHEPSPPVARRGRRSAIYETKNCGDVSPTTLSPEHSPSNSCDEGEGASNIAERLRRRRSSVDLAMNIYPGDLLVQEHHKKLIKRNTIADFYAGRSPSEGPGVPPSDGTDVSKKGRQPFSLLKLMKTRSKENLTRLDDILRRLKPSEFKDNHLAAYKNVHWSDLIASTDKQNPPITISDTERKRREAVWELFKSECVFLIDHCMVLKHCFMEPLKKVQVEGSLMFAEPQDIFGNLDELCYVSYTFCKDFIAALLKDMSVTDFGRTKVLIKAFQRFSTHSKDGAVFHTYCINYTNALAYLDKLRQNSEFAEFERWCEQDPRCNRLQLTDLLVAPMQHCTKLPLLLANIRKYTESEIERQMVTESIEKVETSLQQLEEKMKWIKNVERVQEIQRQIIWPPVAELDPRCVIPDCLKSTLAKQPCERMLSCTKRQLLHEGPLTLMESPKPIDVHVFLFDDLLLITKIKKTARKKQGGDLGAKSPSGGTADRASYVVFRQPLAMDRFTLHDIAPADASASGLKNVMVLVHISRFQQVLGLFTLQAASDAAKVTWLNQIREAKERYAERETSRQNSFKENKDPRGDERDPRADSSLSRSPRRVKRNSLHRKGPSKSRSMDAVFI